MSKPPRPASQPAASWRGQRRADGPGSNLAKSLVYWLLGLVLLAVLAVFLWPKYQPAAHILCLGVTSYDEQLPWRTTFRQEDLRTLADLQAPKIVQVAEQVGALRAEDLANLSSLGREASAALAHEDVLVCYLAAHGVSLDGTAYLVGSDFNPREAESLSRTGLCELEPFLKQFAARPARLKLIVLESGGLLADPAAGMLANEFPLLLEAEVKKLPPESNVWVLCSHGFLETSRVSYAGRYSLFGRAVAEALRGDADGILGEQDGRVQLNELAAYVCWGVQRATQRLAGEDNSQTPLLFAAGRGRVAQLDADANTGAGQAICLVSPAKQQPSPAKLDSQRQTPPAQNQQEGPAGGKHAAGAQGKDSERSRQGSTRGGAGRGAATGKAAAQPAGGAAAQHTNVQDATPPAGQDAPAVGEQPAAPGSTTAREPAPQPQAGEPAARPDAQRPTPPDPAPELWDSIVGRGYEPPWDPLQEDWLALDYAPHQSRAILVRLVREEWLLRKARAQQLAEWSDRLARAQHEFLSPGAGADLYDDHPEVKRAIKVRNRLLFWLPAAIRYFGSSTPPAELDEPLHAALDRLLPVAQERDASRFALVRLLAALRPEESVDAREWLENLASARRDAEEALGRLEQAIADRYKRALAKGERRLTLSEELLQFALLTSQQRAELWQKLGGSANSASARQADVEKKAGSRKATRSSATPADVAAADSRAANAQEAHHGAKVTADKSVFKPLFGDAPQSARLPAGSVNAARVWNRLVQAARWETGCLWCIALDEPRKELLELDQLLETCGLSQRGTNRLTSEVRGRAARAGAKLAKLYAGLPKHARNLLEQDSTAASRAAELWFFLADDRQAENLEREVVARHPVTRPPAFPLPREFSIELAKDLMAEGLELEANVIRGRPRQFRETMLAWRLVSHAGRARPDDHLQFRVQFSAENFAISHQGQALASQQSRTWPGAAGEPEPLALQVTPRFRPGQSATLTVEAILNGEGVARTVHRIEIPQRKPPRLLVRGGAGSQPDDLLLEAQQTAQGGQVLELYPFASGETEFSLEVDPNGAAQELEYRLVLLPAPKIGEFRPDNWVWQANDADLGIQLPHVGPLLMQLGMADGPKPLRFWPDPQPPPAADGAPPAAPMEPQPRQIGGLLAVFYDKLWEDEVRVWIRFDPHPSRYLNDPEVVFDGPRGPGLLRVDATLREPALLAARDPQSQELILELLCDDPRALREDVVKQLKDVISPNRTTAVLQLGLGWLSSNTEETPLFLSADGYPRAYAYRVQRRAGPFQKLREEYRDVRLVQVGPPEAFAAPGQPPSSGGEPPKPATLELDTPDGQTYKPQYFKNTDLLVRVLADAPPNEFRSGRLHLEVGLAPGWANADPAAPKKFYADRQVDLRLLPKARERLRVAVNVQDLLVALDHAAFRNSRASIVARLVARDGTPQLSKWAPVTFDEQAPMGQEIQVSLRADEVRHGRDVRIAGIDVADISGRATWWAGIDKNANGRLDPDEEQEGGQDGTLNLATGGLPNRNASYNVLVRVRDGAGNETPREECGTARFKLTRVSEK